MKDKILKNKKFLAIFAGISLVSIVYLFYSSKPKNIVSEVPSPQETQKINLVLKYPSEDKQVITFPNTALSFKFDAPINQENILVTIKPNILIDTYTSKDGFIFYVKPKFKWIFDTQYQITLRGTTIFVERLFTPLHPEDSKEVFNENPQN
ncbi:MAG: hypothetical protein AAB550_02045 [Patescibacteria group bacterium]